MKTKTIVIIILCALVIFAARNYIKDFVTDIIDNGGIDYTEQQQSAIDSFKEGAGNVFNLMKEGLFTLDELVDLGILEKDHPLESLGELIDKDNRFSMSDVDITKLNLEHLSSEQISLLGQVISGDMTMTQLIATGKFSFSDFQKMGLFEMIISSINKSEN